MLWLFGDSVPKLTRKNFTQSQQLINLISFAEWKANCVAFLGGNGNFVDVFEHIVTFTQVIKQRST